MQVVCLFLVLLAVLQFCEGQGRGSKKYTPSPFLQREDLHFLSDPISLEDSKAQDTFSATKEQLGATNTRLSVLRNFATTAPTPRRMFNTESPLASNNPLSKPPINFNSVPFTSEPLTKNAHTSVITGQKQSARSRDSKPLTASPQTESRTGSGSTGRQQIRVAERLKVQRRRNPALQSNPSPVVGETAEPAERRQLRPVDKPDWTFPVAGRTPILSQSQRVRSWSDNDADAQLETRREIGSLDAGSQVLRGVAFHAGDNISSTAFIHNRPNSRPVAQRRLPDESLTRSRSSNEHNHQTAAAPLDSSKDILAARRARFQRRKPTEVTHKIKPLPSLNAGQFKEQILRQSTSTTSVERDDKRKQNLLFGTNQLPNFAVNQQWINSIPPIGSIPLAKSERSPESRQEFATDSAANDPSSIQSIRSSSVVGEKDIFEPGTFSFSSGGFDTDSARTDLLHTRTVQPTFPPKTLAQSNEEIAKLPGVFSDNIVPFVNAITLPPQTTPPNTVSFHHLDSKGTGSQPTTPDFNNPASIITSPVFGATFGGQNLQQRTKPLPSNNEIQNSETIGFHSENNRFTPSPSNSESFHRFSLPRAEINNVQQSAPVSSSPRQFLLSGARFTPGTFHIVDGQLRTAPFPDLAARSSLTSDKFSDGPLAIPRPTLESASTDQNLNGPTSSHFAKSSNLRLSRKSDNGDLQTLLTPPTHETPLHINVEAKDKTSNNDIFFRPNELPDHLRFDQEANNPQPGRRRGEVSSILSPTSVRFNRDGASAVQPIIPSTNQVERSSKHVKTSRSETTESRAFNDRETRLNLSVRDDKSVDLTAQPVSFPTFHQAVASNTNRRVKTPSFNAPSFGSQFGQFQAEHILSKPSTATEVLPGFTCEGREYGYYADVINKCRVFHICQPVHIAPNSTRYYTRYSFSCGRETIFDQSKLACIHEREAMPCRDSAQWPGDRNANSPLVEQ